jgi:N-acetyl-gamma-glutamyl-phosphate reductase
MKNVLIVGATGFGGLGLIEILLKHPGFRINQLVARKDVSKKVSSVFPHLKGYCDMTVMSPDEIDYDSTDIAFLSTPDRAGMTMIEEFTKRGIPVIDFSGDFRFLNTADYSVYAVNKGMDDIHLAPWALDKTVYGLPELFADKIRTASIVGNPGCFAICMILALLPAVHKGIISSDTIICDGKTGVSGAGKSSGEANLYPQRHENVNTYREGRHQHLVEVENLLNGVSDSGKKIMFVPQIVPLNRGIMITAYAQLNHELNTADLLELYSEYYKNKPFVAVTPDSPNTADVRGSNRCAVRPMYDARTGTFFVTAVIDNLLKGQSGNAVQNANLMCGYDETEGLNFTPFYP